jgi:uncharacterized membrane protein YphA (DoxX/SURF4 family)
MRYIAYIFSCIGISSVLGVRFASAHVAYVLPPETIVQNSGTDFAFLFSPLTNINNLVIIIASLLLVGAIYYLGHHTPMVLTSISKIKHRLTGYDDLVPLFLRVGLGILFMGAAFHNVFVSPVIPYFPTIGGLELILGFCLFLGLFVTPALLTVIAFYFVGLAHNGYIIGNLEVLGAAVALLLLGTSRPGLDDILGIPTFLRNKWAMYAPLVLRICLGGALIFLAFYEKIFNPHYFSTVVETYNLTSLIAVSPAMWTLSAGIIELLLGLLILFGFKTRLTSILGFLVVTILFFIFNEDVYAHVTIFVTLSVLLITGGGHWSLDEYIEHAKHAKAKSSTPKAPRAIRKIAAKKASRKRAAKKVA